MSNLSVKFPLTPVSGAAAIRIRRSFIDRLEKNFMESLQQEVKILQNQCSHPSIALSPWCGDDVGIECSDCRKIVLDPYEQAN